MHKNIGQFLIKSSQNINEINSQLIELVHLPTGAEIIYLGADDRENAFNIALRTYPESSNGAGHILEHIVLCGSEKFPVKDPFFAMSRRSMNTFMNALTGSDFTCYPAASMIEADFYNILTVYLDAVFHPRLLEESFWQEGIHLDFKEMGNSNSPLTISGIVYNEMKGAMANPETRLHDLLYKHLLPDLPYRYNAGGDPDEIRTITFREVKAFHEKYYHPSRALFYFYGNLPLEKHLDFLEKHLLSKTGKLAPISSLPKQKRFKEKVYINGSYPISLKEKKADKNLIAFGWLTSSLLEQDEILALNVLDLALMGTDAGPLKEAILRSNLCKNVDSYLDDEISEIPFVISCSGCKESASDELEHIIIVTLQEIMEKGIPEDLIEGALHQLEFLRTEIVGNSLPYGLSLFFRSALVKLHGGDPSYGLKIHTLFKALREKFKDPHYFPHLIQKYLLGNAHFVRVVLEPDIHLGTKEENEETQFIKKEEESLTEELKKTALEEKARLIRYQQEEGDLEILPRLGLKDVPVVTTDYPLNIIQEETCTLFHHNCFTNDIIYVSYSYEIPDLPEKDLIYLRLFTLFSSEIGSGKRNYQENLNYIFEYTGGIYGELDIYMTASNLNNCKTTFAIRGKSLRRYGDKLFSLFSDMLISLDFTDKRRIEELMTQHIEAIEKSIERNPLRYAVNLSISNFSKAGRLQEIWFGIDHYEEAKKVFKEFKQNPEPFVSKMREIQEKLLGTKGEDVILSLSDSLFEDVMKNKLFTGKKTKGAVLNENSITLKAVPSHARIISSPVAFTILSLPTVPYIHPYSSVLSVASELMQNITLHKKIREQGGAYGAGASHSPAWGYFYFYSFRDPHLKKTLESFQQGAEDIASGKFTDRELEEAKLGIFQALGTPHSPENRAVIAYSWYKSERTLAIRQDFRDRLFATSREQIQKAAEEYLLPGKKENTLICFAGEELLHRENRLLKSAALPIIK